MACRVRVMPGDGGCRVTAPDPEAVLLSLAAWLLFTTEPSDRALAGWCAAEWLTEELDELGLRERIA